MDKGKIFLIIGFLLLLIGVPVAIFVLKQETVFRLGAQDPNRPANVQVNQITDQSAIITWATTKPVQALISYGLSPASLTLIYPEKAPALNHQAELKNLLPETKYFFVIKVADKIFDDNDQPFSFTTLTRLITLTPSPGLDFTQAELEAAMGTNNPKFDLNKDGIVNTLDLLLFQKQNK